MSTATKPPCICGCIRSDEAMALRRAVKAKAERKRAVDHAAFDLYFADLKAGRTLMAPTDYIAIAEEGTP